jgi:hypothetical protein
MELKRGADRPNTLSTLGNKLDAAPTAPEARLAHKNFITTHFPVYFAHLSGRRGCIFVAFMTHADSVGVQSARSILREALHHIFERSNLSEWKPSGILHNAFGTCTPPRDSD